MRTIVRYAVGVCFATAIVSPMAGCSDFSLPGTDPCPEVQMVFVSLAPSDSPTHQVYAQDTDCLLIVEYDSNRLYTIDDLIVDAQGEIWVDMNKLRPLAEGSSQPANVSIVDPRYNPTIVTVYTTDSSLVSETNLSRTELKSNPHYVRATSPINSSSK